MNALLSLPAKSLKSVQPLVEVSAIVGRMLVEVDDVQGRHHGQDHYEKCDDVGAVAVVPWNLPCQSVRFHRAVRSMSARMWTDSRSSLKVTQLSVRSNEDTSFQSTCAGQTASVELILK